MATNTKQKDNAARVIFENAELCSQFLREYSNIELLRNVRAEDIEDMTERFLPMFSEEREADVVKKIKLPEKGELFILALIEHKSSVDYNVVMQMFHYMSYIWEEYERSMEAEKRGITKTKDFKYPPIIPIVYYEDNATWTSALTLSERIFLSDVIHDYIPDYRYFLFPLQHHGNDELISKQDEISLIMLINKLRDIADFKKLNFPNGYFENLKTRMSGDVMIVLAKLIKSYLREINLPEDDINGFVDQVREGDMTRFFENFHKFDIQEFARQNEAKGEAKGEDIKLIKQIHTKYQKGKDAETIAEELEEDLETVNKIIAIIDELDGEEFTADRVYEKLRGDKIAV